MGCGMELDRDRVGEGEGGLQEAHRGGSSQLSGSGFTLMYELCFWRPEPSRFPQIHFTHSKIYIHKFYKRQMSISLGSWF